MVIIDLNELCEVSPKLFHQVMDLVRELPIQTMSSVVFSNKRWHDKCQGWFDPPRLDDAPVPKLIW